MAELVKTGKKQQPAPYYAYMNFENEPFPQTGEYSVILDSNGEAVCIIRTTNVYITSFDKVSEEHALKEGEGNRTLDVIRNIIMYDHHY